MKVTKRDKALLRRMKGRNQTSRSNPEWLTCLSPSEKKSAAKLTRMGFLDKQRQRTGHVVAWICTGDEV